MNLIIINLCNIFITIRVPSEALATYLATNPWSTLTTAIAADSAPSAWGSDHKAIGALATY
jgi:hypothetical protein